MKKNLLLQNHIISFNKILHKTGISCFLVFILCLTFSSHPAQAQLTKVWETPPFKHSSGSGSGFVKQAVDGAGNLIILGAELTLYKYDATGKQLWSANQATDDNYASNRDLQLDKANNSYVLWGKVLLKYSPSGSLTWSKTFDANSGNISSVTDMTMDAEGNIYVTGRVDNGDGTTVMGTQKMSSAGAVLWTTKTPELYYGETIGVDNKGSVYVSTSAVINGVQNIDLVKFNATTGAQLLRKTYDTPRIPGYSENTRKIMITKAGEAYILCDKSSGYNGKDKQIFFYKVATDGTLIYKKGIGKSEEEVLFDAVFAANEDIIVLGRLLKYRITWDHFMTRVNANADHVWYHSFNVYEADNMVRYFAPSSNNGMAVNADGSIAIAGSYSFLRVTQMGMPEVYTEYPKFILATFSKDGKETWRQVMDHTTSREGSAGVSLINDKSLYFAGALSTLPSFNSPVNMVAMKYQDCSGFAASAGQDIAVCAGGSVQLQATGGTTYSWSPATGLSATNVANPVATPTAATTYTVTVTNAEGCTATDQVVVTVNPNPTASITAGSATTFCSGGSVILTANSGTGLTHQWLKNGTPIDQATASTYTATTAGDYTVLVKNSTGCTATSAATKVSITAAITASAGADKEICAGSSVQLQATGGTTYSWSPATGLSAANIANPVASPSQTTTYTVTVTSAGGCSDTDQVIVKVNSPPAASITISGSTTICQGSSAILTANSGTGFTYQWLRNGSAINQATGNTYTATTAGDYAVIVKNSSGCTATSTFVKVAVTTGVTASAGADKEICAGESVQLEASGGTIYTWSPATGLSATNIANPVASPAATTTYTVTVSNANGCSATDQVVVKVNASPTASITAAGATTFCEGESVVLNANQSAGYTYQWFKDGNPINQATGSSFTTFAGGDFAVRITNESGCVATSAAIKVKVNSPVSVTAGDAQSICANAAAFTLTGFSPAGGTWSGTGVNAAGLFNPATAGAGEHTLTYTVTQNNCTAKASKVITVTPAAAAAGAITGNAAVCTGTSNLTYTIDAVTGAENYTWTVPNGFTITGGQGTRTLTVTAGNTSGNITVAAGNNCGTSAPASIAVTVNSGPEVSLAAFTKMCTEDDVLTLTGGQPAGGNYSGTGITNGIFDPVTAGVGNHTITYTYSDANGCSATATQTIEVEAECSVTGVEDEEPPHKFVFYPNPAKDRLNIEVELPDRTDVTIRLADARGRIILQEEFTGQVGAFTKTLLLQNKARGMYFLQFTTKDGSYNRKIVLW